MTTPAVDVRTVIHVPNYYIAEYHLNNGTVNRQVSYRGQGDTQMRARARPASSLNRLDDTGWRNPSNYHSVVEHGSSHNVSASRINPGYGQVSWWGETLTGNWLVNWIPTAPEYRWSMIPRAEIKALQKLKDQRVNFGVAIAEAREVSEQLVGTTHRIVDFVRNFRKRRPKAFNLARKNQGKGVWRSDYATSAKAGSRKTRYESKQIPEDWLAFQYGVAPLVNDIQGAYSALADKSRGKPFRCTVEAYIREQGESRSRAYFGMNDPTPIGFADIISEYRHFAFVQLTYTLDSAALATIADMGLSNPLEVIWERVPYSFLVDQVLPIGNSLSTLDADYGWNFVAGCNTIGYQSTYAGTAQELKTTRAPWSVSGDVSGKMLRFQRSVYHLPPGFRMPQFKNPLSLGHVANAMSLLVQAFR